MNSTFLKINNFIEETKVEGPFIRSALWLQGCSILCEDCCNQHMQNFDEGTKTTIEKLYESILSAKAENNEIEGLTILGGEPLDQAKSLKKLLKTVKEKITNYGIILFTGYNWEEVQNDKEKAETAKLCDLLIAGPYNKSLKSASRRWIGSDNQTAVFVTDRYAKSLTPWPKGVIEIEITFNDYEISVNGTPTEGKLI
jgi:anaerobic ribonucleoside-triphosphate reductase activating protein